jgi:hypothetical protein
LFQEFNRVIPDQAAMTLRRRRRPVLRLFAVLALIVLVAPVLAAAGALVFVDPNDWRPRIEDSVQRATGRALHLGRLHLVAAL